MTRAFLFRKDTPHCLISPKYPKIYFCLNIEKYALVEWLNHVCVLSSQLYQWKAKSRSPDPMDKESEAGPIQAVSAKLAELDERLKFSPFIAGNKISFADILLEETVLQMQLQFDNLDINKMLKGKGNVSRVVEYVRTIKPVE